MKVTLLALAAAGLLSATAAYAQSGADVVKAKGCLNCHEMDKKKVGPGFKDIASRRQGKADEIVAKLKDGKGHMKIAASEAEIKAAVEYVLSQK